MDKKKLQQLYKERDRLINQINTGIESSFLTSQSAFFKLFTDRFLDLLQRDEAGLIINNQFNRNLMLKVDAIFTTFYKASNPLIITAIIGGVSKVIDFNNKYYGLMVPGAKLLPLKEKVQNNIKGWLGIDKGNIVKPNGYLDTILKFSDVKKTIQDFSLKSVYGQQGWDTTKKQLGDLLGEQKADGKNIGKMESYYRNYSYDLISQVDRATAKTYAEDLKFEFAIYEGGLIKTSRQFCIDRNGKVFHKTEIAKFHPTKAIPDDYNPFTDLGGFGCRHHLNWIPNSLAFILRPDAEEYLKSLEAA